MSLDFLRQLAFERDLRNFFREDPFDFGERATGLSLRFDPEFLRAVARRVGSYYDRELVSNFYLADDFSHELWSVLDRWEESPWWDHGYYNPWEGRRREIVQILVDEDQKGGFRGEGPDNYEGFPIKYRERGPIVPQFACGAQIEAPSTKLGTVCGFFEDGASGQRYGLTCGHVAGGVGDKMQGSGSLTGPFGDVVAHEVPSVIGNCNQSAQPGLHAVDAALIELDPTVMPNFGSDRTAAPISGINDGDFVTFVGQGSRKSAKARVMSATIWKRFDVDKSGTLVCFGDIFEITHRKSQYVATALSKDGDSGAAVLKPGSNGAPDEWLGMLVGSARSSSYVCYAENIMSWMTAAYPAMALKP